MLQFSLEAALLVIYLCFWFKIVPKDQLLVFDVKEGWQPLCDFLGIPVPDIPFPHKNKGGAVLQEYRKENPVMHRIEKELKISLACLFALLMAGAYKAFQMIW